jgi:hypothetical protein
MATHDRKELDREDRLIQVHTRASLMSDTKWRKLLSALDRSELELRHCIVKFVGVQEEKVLSRPAGLYPPRPWVDTFQFGPIPLRSIEWLLFPRVAEVRGADRTIPARRVEQDVDGAARVVETLGRYPAELSKRGLLIVGHLASEIAD